MMQRRSCEGEFFGTHSLLRASAPSCRLISSVRSLRGPSRGQSPWFDESLSTSVEIGWVKGGTRVDLQCCVENADEEIRVGLQVPRDEILVFAGDAVDLHCDFDEWVFRVNVA